MCQMCHFSIEGDDSNHFNWRGGSPPHPSSSPFNLSTVCVSPVVYDECTHWSVCLSGTSVQFDVRALK